MLRFVDETPNQDRKNRKQCDNLETQKDSALNDVQQGIRVVMCEYVRRDKRLIPTDLCSG